MTAVNPSSAKPPQAPPDVSLVADTVKTKLPFRVELAKLAPLAGDASNADVACAQRSVDPPAFSGRVERYSSNSENPKVRSTKKVKSSTRPTSASI